MKFHSISRCFCAVHRRTKGSVTVEYLLLLTLVGIDAIVGLYAVRNAIINELNELSVAINAINSP